MEWPADKSELELGTAIQTQLVGQPVTAVCISALQNSFSGVSSSKDTNAISISFNSACILSLML